MPHINDNGVVRTYITVSCKYADKLSQLRLGREHDSKVGKTIWFLNQNRYKSLDSFVKQYLTPKGMEPCRKPNLLDIPHYLECYYQVNLIVLPMAREPPFFQKDRLWVPPQHAVHSYEIRGEFRIKVERGYTTLERGLHIQEF
jgi:hypothetical protein